MKSSAGFVDVLKVLGKCKKTFEGRAYPTVIIRNLSDFETEMIELASNREGVKKLSKLRAQSLSKVRNRLRDSLDDFREAIEAYRADPCPAKDASDESSAPSESSADEAVVHSAAGSAADGFSSSSLSGSSESESEAESYESVSEGEDEMNFEKRHAKAMIKWGYKDKDIAAAGIPKESRKDLALKRREETQRRRLAREKIKEASVAAAAADGARRMSVLLPDSDLMDETSVLLKAQEVVAARNKRGAERLEQLQILRRLAETAQAKFYYKTLLEVLSSLVTFGLDTIQISGLPPTEECWREVRVDLWNMLSLLLMDKGVYLVGEMVVESVDVIPNQSAVTQTAARILSFVERLDDGLNRALQAADWHLREYKDRLAQTVEMMALLWVTYSWLLAEEKKGLSLPETWRVQLRLIDSLYYIPDRLASSKWLVIQKFIGDNLESSFRSVVPCPVEKPSVAVEDLATSIFSRCARNDVTPLFRAQAALIYNLALHDHFTRARDMFAGANMYDIAMSLDVSEQILYNRALTQLGLAAFRKGMIQYCVNALNDICGGTRQKEFLAQAIGMVKGLEKTPEQEKAERRRLLPAHMHIDIDLIESVYQISSMLLEVPFMSGTSALLENRQRPTRFRRAMEIFERTAILPESSREIIIIAARSLLKGEWEDCSQHVLSLKCWQHIQPEEKRSEVQNLIVERIKGVALRSYVINYSKLYDSMSIGQISDMFETPRKKVFSLISKVNNR